MSTRRLLVLGALFSAVLLFSHDVLARGGGGGGGRGGGGRGGAASGGRNGGRTGGTAGRTGARAGRNRDGGLAGRARSGASESALREERLREAEARRQMIGARRESLMDLDRQVQQEAVLTNGRRDAIEYEFRPVR